MATHSQNISNLENAVYGEQVRRSMIELFEEDYALVKKAIGYGTDIDSPTSSIAGYYDGNLYINSDTHDIWEMDGIGWHIVGNVLSIKDITVVESQIDDDNNVVTIQFTDGRTPLVFNVKNGKTGNGISSIDTIVSPDDDGINQVIINMTDGTSKSFSTKNGSKGSKGDKGDTGNPAGFGTPTATIDRNTGIPTVVVTASGSDETKVFNFDFKNLKGETGDKGDTGRGLDSITSIDSGKNHTLAANYSDGVSQVIATIKDGADGSGVGDMVKATYDTDDNGIVDKAEALFDVATGTTVPAKTILNKADKANTLVGYGITDAYTKVQVNAELDKKVNEPLAEGQDGYVLTTDGQGRREWKKGASDWNSLTDKPFETLGTDFEVKTVGEGDEEREELQLSTNVTDKLDTVGDIVEDGFYSRNILKYKSISTSTTTYTIDGSILNLTPKSANAQIMASGIVNMEKGKTYTISSKTVDPSGIRTTNIYALQSYDSASNTWGTIINVNDGDSYTYENYSGDTLYIYNYIAKGTAPSSIDGTVSFYNQIEIGTKATEWTQTAKSNVELTNELKAVSESEAWIQRTWKVGEVCIHNGKIWYCKLENTIEPTEGNYWEQVSLKRLSDKTINVESGTIVTGVTYSKLGRIMQLNIKGTFELAASTNNILGTLPSGMRPLTEVQFLAFTEDSTPKITIIRLQQTGAIIENGWILNGSRALRGSFVYMTEK